VSCVLEEVRERYVTFPGRVGRVSFAVARCTQPWGHNIDVLVGGGFVLDTELTPDFEERRRRDSSHDLTSLTWK
jgi:hypothetical protein